MRVDGRNLTFFLCGFSDKSGPTAGLKESVRHRHIERSFEALWLYFPGAYPSFTTPLTALVQILACFSPDLSKNKSEMGERKSKMLVPEHLWYNFFQGPKGKILAPLYL